MDKDEAQSLINEAESLTMEMDSLGYEVASAQKFIKLAKAFFKQNNFEKAHEFALKAYSAAKAVEKAKEEESVRDLQTAYEGSKVSAEELERALPSSAKLGGSVIVEKKASQAAPAEPVQPSSSAPPAASLANAKPYESIPDKPKLKKKLKGSGDLKVVEYAGGKKEPAEKNSG